MVMMGTILNSLLFSLHIHQAKKIINHDICSSSINGILVSHLSHIYEQKEICKLAENFHRAQIKLYNRIVNIILMKVW